MADLRVALRIAGMFFGLLFALPLHLIWRLFRLGSPWPRLYLGWAARLSGARVRVVGIPLRSHALLLANHQSPVDIPALAGATGCCFVAKGDLERTPIVGLLAKLNQTIFVARGDRLGVAEQVEAVRKGLDRDRPVAIFPEGGTGDGITLQPFKPSLLAALDPAPPGVLVQPVRIDYGAAITDIAWPDEESGPAYMRRVLGRSGSFAMTLHLLEPFAPGEYPGRKAIAAEARRRIEAPAFTDAP